MQHSRFATEFGSYYFFGRKRKSRKVFFSNKCTRFPLLFSSPFFWRAGLLSVSSFHCPLFMDPIVASVRDVAARQDLDLVPSNQGFKFAWANGASELWGREGVIIIFRLPETLNETAEEDKWQTNVVQTLIALPTGWACDRLRRGVNLPRPPCGDGREFWRKPKSGKMIQAWWMRRNQAPISRHKTCQSV